MGTNYYTVGENKTCGECGAVKDVVKALHIGKSSGGWRFLFRGHQEEGLLTASAWWAYLETRKIVDEYGKPVSLDELKKWVASKQSEKMPDERHMQNGYLSFTDPDGFGFVTSDFS